VAENLLTAHPEAIGAWASYDGPAMGVAAAARTLGVKDFTITTVDLSVDSAVDIARKDGMVKGTGSQQPFAQGQAESLAAVNALLGKKVPTYIGVPGLKVTRENVVEAFRTIYAKDPPQEIIDFAAE
jgi:ribose transport system substrate-binding protein